MVVAEVGVRAVAAVAAAPVQVGLVVVVLAAAVAVVVQAAPPVVADRLVLPVVHVRRLLAEAGRRSVEIVGATTLIQWRCASHRRELSRAYRQRKQSPLRSSAATACTN